MERGGGMLTYSFSEAEKVPLYEQLYCHIKGDILAGRLHADEKLPSKRSFSKNLGVSNTTVEAAYGQLVTEGYLYALPKKGFFVSALERQVRSLPTLPKPREDVPPAQQECFVADFLGGSVATEQFPFSVWLKLLRQVMSSEEEKILLTARPAGGLLQLREAIAAHLRDFRGMQVQPGQIVVGAGAEYLYSVLIQLLGRRSVYGVEDPGYLRLRLIYEGNDVQCRHIPMDEYGVKVKVLEDSQAEILHITPSHHNPTGIVMPARRRYELLDWAAQGAGRYIIEDDYDCEFRLSGKPIPTLQSIDAGEKVIYLNTFSQSLAPAFRMSYLVLPEHLARRFYADLGFYSGTVSCFEQLTLARFLSEGYFEKHLNRMRNYYRALRDRFVDALRASPLGARSTITREDAGLHFLLTVETKARDEDIIARGAALGLQLSFLSQYYHDEALRLEHVLLVKFSSISPDRVEETVRRLCACFVE